MFLRTRSLGKCTLIAATVVLVGVTCSCDVTIDEAGNGSVVFSSGGTPVSLFSDTRPDPGPGGGSNVLFYFSPSSVAGDIVIQDPNGDPSDLLRIDTNLGGVFVYSADSGKIGDQPIPSQRNTNVVVLTEDPFGRVTYTPSAGQPGFVTSQSVTYHFRSAGTPDIFQIGYAANLGAGPSVVNMTNAGTNGGGDKVDWICANVYVFAEDQQLISCCTCPLSPNDLRTLSVQTDLINNTLTPGVPTGITIALLASDDTGQAGCNAATVDPTKLVSGLRAWGTHLHAAPGGGFAVTENHFLRAPLSIGPGSEFEKMTSFCSFIQANGSKYGICNSCKQGAQGAKK